MPKVPLAKACPPPSVSFLAPALQVVATPSSYHNHVYQGSRKGLHEHRMGVGRATCPQAIQGLHGRYRPLGDWAREASLQPTGSIQMGGGISHTRPKATLLVQWLSSEGTSCYPRGGQRAVGKLGVQGRGKHGGLFPPSPPTGRVKPLSV